jgi:hypothetical protein
MLRIALVALVMMAARPSHAETPEELLARVIVRYDGVKRFTATFHHGVPDHMTTGRIDIIHGGTGEENWTHAGYGGPDEWGARVMYPPDPEYFFFDPRVDLAKVSVRDSAPSWWRSGPFERVLELKIPKRDPLYVVIDEENARVVAVIIQRDRHVPHRFHNEELDAPYPAPSTATAEQIFSGVIDRYARHEVLSLRYVTGTGDKLVDGTVFIEREGRTREDIVQGGAFVGTKRWRRDQRPIQYAFFEARRKLRSMKVSLDQPSWWSDFPGTPSVVLRVELPKKQVLHLVVDPVNFRVRAALVGTTEYSFTSEKRDGRDSERVFDTKS